MQLIGQACSLADTLSPSDLHVPGVASLGWPHRLIRSTSLWFALSMPH
jgi:hypothetical protein